MPFKTEQEAGCKGKVGETLVSRHVVVGGKMPELYTIYALQIEDVLSDWPELKERERRFVSVSEAQHLLESQLRRKDREAMTLALAKLASIYSV